jgi:hypothetical protein
MIFKLTGEEYLEMDECGGGFCLSCGEQVYGVEPDVRNYTCDECGAKEVFGASELLLMGNIEII